MTMVSGSVRMGKKGLRKNGIKVRAEVGIGAGARYTPAVGHRVPESRPGVAVEYSIGGEERARYTAFCWVAHLLRRLHFPSCDGQSGQRLSPHKRCDNFL